MTDLPQLLGRAEAATGPDRELDAAILDAVHVWPWGGPYNCWRTAAQAFGWDVRVTASLDAALALVERRFPGPYPLASKCQVAIERDWGGQWRACLTFPATPNGPPCWTSCFQDGTTPALAVVAALLAAVASSNLEKAP